MSVYHIIEKSLLCATTTASTETASSDSTTTTTGSSSTSTPPAHHQQQQQQPAVFGGRTRNTRRRDTTGRRHFPERALSARAFPSALSGDRFATAGAYNNKSPALHLHPPHPSLTLPRTHF
ncbi:hypothetical protein ACI65C_010974 [Semiaphis heraclei]